MLEALEDLNLRDLNSIIEALVVSHENAKNEDKVLIFSTIGKIAKARSQQIDWLYKEYGGTDSNE